jgi:uncharacterized protein (DUF362 family)
VKTDNRKNGVRTSLKALNINPVKGKDVLIKPNFNTADITPGSTHNDTLVALVEEVWGMGAKSISLGERSYPPTREVMEKKGILPILDKLNVNVIDFDDLTKRIGCYSNLRRVTGRMAFGLHGPSLMQNVSSPPAA